MLREVRSAFGLLEPIRFKGAGRRIVDEKSLLGKWSDGPLGLTWSL
jgi:hypothetical protein